MSKTVAILGASPDPARFANKAMQKLKNFGHKVILVNPAYQDIEGHPVLNNLSEISEPVDTLTLYVNPIVSQALTEEILDLRPQRVVFNPGTESKDVMKALDEHRIVYIKACTLVMLDSGVF